MKLIYIAIIFILTVSMIVYAEELNDYSDGVIPTDQDVVSDTTLDVAPVIDDIYIHELTPNSVIITWTTDVLADSQVDYGTDRNYERMNLDPAMTSAHSITLNDLHPGTVYYFVISSSDVSGTIALSDSYTFTTRLATETNSNAIIQNNPSEKIQQP